MGRRQAAQALGKLISVADVEHLILTRRYDALLASVGLAGFGSAEVEGVVNGLVSTELDERVAAFEQACETLRRQIDRWSRNGSFVVADTSLYIEHHEKLEELDFASLINVREEPIHVLIPIVVIDELDSLKQSKDRCCPLMPVRMSADSVRRGLAVAAVASGGLVEAFFDRGGDHPAGHAVHRPVLVGDPPDPAAGGGQSPAVKSGGHTRSEVDSAGESTARAPCAAGRRRRS